MEKNFNKYRRFFAVAIAAAVGLASVTNAFAVKITLASPGTLKTELNNPSEIKELTLDGRVDASDLRFIAREMAELTALDLGDCEIVAYDDERLDGRTTYPADEIPSLFFCGSELQRIVFPKTGQLTIGDGAFAGAKLETVVLPENVSKVGDGAFAGCQTLREVSVGTAEFGRGVFEDCANLVAADVSSAGKTGEAMFRGCTSLNKIEGSEKLTEISARSFENCETLKAITLGPGLVRIGARAFAGSGLKRLDLKECKVLGEIGPGILAECRKLKTATFGPTQAEISFATLLGDSLLTDVTLPKELNLIGDYALAGTKGIAELQLPGKVEAIETGAMQNMTALKSIDATALTAPPATGENVWDGVNQPGVTLTVGEGLGQTFKQAEQWGDFHIVESAGVEDAMLDGQNGIDWTINGDLLTVKSRNAKIVSLKVFNAGGREVTAVSPSAEEATVDLTDHALKVFIISVKTDNGYTTVIKAARQ